MKSSSNAGMLFWSDRTRSSPRSVKSSSPSLVATNCPRSINGASSRRSGMSYGTDLAEAYRLLGGYAGRILKGARPEELPVQQLTKVDLVLNLKTAKSLGLTLPISLLGRADEIIE